MSVIDKKLFFGKKISNKKFRRWQVTVCISAMLSSFLQASAAKAQTIDYGSLQSLFGEPVTTSATGKPQKASEAPVAMEIITAEQIRRGGVTSIPEVLSRATGITTWQPSRSSADVGVRGQNTDYNPTLLVLVNGRQVYNDSYGFTDWSMIPVQLEEIRQIEVVKGPTSALYGFNAVSGVVNIVTYNPKYDKAGGAGVAAGTGNYGRAYGVQTAKISDKASIRVSSSLERFDEFAAKSNTQFARRSLIDNIVNRKVMADSLITLSDKTQLRIEGSYVSADNNDAPITFFLEPADKVFWSGKADLTSETSIGLIEANLYNNSSNNHYVGTYTGGVTNNVTVAQLQDLFKVGTNHTFRLQGEYRHNAIQSTVFSGAGAKTFYDVVSTGGMWNWAITPALEITNSARLDHLMLGRTGPLPTAVPFTSNDQFNQNITDYSLNSGAVWKATEIDTLRASYGRGIQAPSLFNFGLVYPLQAGVVVAGEPNLDPTVVTNYEVGYDRFISQIAGKFRSSLFYRKTENINAVNGKSYFSGATFVYQATDIGESKTGGLELGFDGKIGSNWDWGASYIYQNTLDDLNSGASARPSSVTIHYENTVPHHVIKGHIGYKTGAWEADAYGEAASKFEAVYSNGTAYNLEKLNGYYTLGGRIAYTFTNNITVAVHGSDLTQERVQNSYGLQNERRAFLSVSKKF